MLLAGVVMPHNVEAAGAVAANVEAGEMPAPSALIFPMVSMV